MDRAEPTDGAEPMDRAEPTTLALTRPDRIAALGMGAGAGVAIGVLLPLTWSWLDDLEWLPFRGVAELLMSADAPAIAVLRPAGLALVGLALMAVWAAGQPRLAISDTEIEVDHRGQRRVIRRDQVAGVYLRGSHVVIDSVEGRRLFDDEIEGAKRHAAQAFRDHDYPWESREH